MCSSYDSIKVVVSFPREIDLQNKIEILNHDYPSLENMEILTEGQLFVILDSIVDLLDIDFVQSYGATAVQLINSTESTDSVKYRLENLNSTQYGSQQILEPQSMIELDTYFQGLRPEYSDPKLPFKLERLTSLEDEVVEDQNITKMFSLDPTSQEIIFWAKRDGDEVEQPETLEEVMQKDEQELEPQKEQMGWMSVLNGVAMTALLVGGVKMARLFFN